MSLEGVDGLSGRYQVISEELMAKSPPDEIDLLSLWKVLWKYKHVIVLTTALFGAVAAALALIATPLYRAEVVITQVREDALGGASSLMNQVGGLASLVGVNLQMGDAERDGAAVLQSRRLVEEFIKRHVPLSMLFTETEKPQSVWLGVKRFRENVLTIKDNSREGTIAITMEWTDPVTAARWANDFVALANELMRARALDESNRNIRYINDQLAHTDVVELRKVMFSIIENETKRLMLANGRIEYAFMVVDPAVAPEIRSSPKRTLMVIVGAILGGCIGAITALILNARARYRHSS